jgi:hypothetical protein
MSALIKNPSMLCEQRPSVSFGPTSYERTFSDDSVSDEEEVVTKVGDGPDQYKIFFGKLVETYLTDLYRTPNVVQGHLGDEVIDVLGDSIIQSIQDILNVFSDGSPAYALYHDHIRLDSSHTARLQSLQTVIRIAQLEIRYNAMIEEQIKNSYLIGGSS